MEIYLPASHSDMGHRRESTTEFPGSGEAFARATIGKTCSTKAHRPFIAPSHASANKSKWRPLYGQRATETYLPHL